MPRHARTDLQARNTVACLLLEQSHDSPPHRQTKGHGRAGPRNTSTQAPIVRVCAEALSLPHVEAHLDALISSGTGDEARIRAHRGDVDRSEKAATRSSHSRQKAASWRFWKSSQRAPHWWGRARSIRARAPPRRARQQRGDASATAVRWSARRRRPRATSPGCSNVERGHRDGRRGVAGPCGARVVDGGVLG